MNQENQLAVRHQELSITASSRGVALTSLSEMLEFARHVVNSKLAPRSFTTPEAVMIAVQFGAELGLSPMQALQNTAVINGKVGLYGNATLAICMRDPSFVDCEEWFEVDAQRIKDEDAIRIIKLEKDKKNLVAVCEMKAKDRVPVRRAFSIKDAQVADLWGKGGPWTQYPARMMRYKARHMAENDCFPNALKGIPMAEDLESGEYQPKQAKVREIATGLVLPDEPESKPEEPLTIQPADNDGTDAADFTKGEELFK
jgi:hypothetical protein